MVECLAMQQASILAETNTLTEVRGESSDPDRGIPFAETHSVTQVRGETDDPDRGVTFAETQTLTKANNESRDDDQPAIVQSVDWNRGDQRPLLFRGAVPICSEAHDLGYDEELDVAVDRGGRPLVAMSLAPETMSVTDARGELNDPDQ
jgi:hypothetical protein